MFCLDTMAWFSSFCLFCFCSLVISYHLEESDSNLEQEWDSFKATFGRDFVSEDDENMRKEIFEKNSREISEHNMRYSRGLETYEMGVNQFSDLTLEEFSSTMLGCTVPEEDLERNETTFLSPLSLVDLPKEVDWRKKGLVTRVKFQGSCGSCWAFSSTGSIEGQNARKNKKLVSLSEQNLVDCSKKYGNNGCRNGFMDGAFQYVKENGGIDTETSYPYVAREQNCKFNKQTIGAKVTGFTRVPKNEKKLMEAVATVGPISVAVDASLGSFKSYKRGIYSDPRCSSTKLDHAVLVVGYGTEAKHDYWLIKNSWNTQWGEQGYMKMARNKNNLCGIASRASYPLV